MSVWTDLDTLVARHKAQARELVDLAKEGKRYRKPRFRPPCVWTLIPRSVAPPSSRTRRRLLVRAGARRAEATRRSGSRAKESEALT